MNPQRLRDAYEKLQLLDERMTHRVRPRPGGSLVRPTPEAMEASMRDLAAYTVELKEIVSELILAIATRPTPPTATGEGTQAT